MNEEQKVELKLIHMEEVVSKEVSWLWYPYIPYGKITVIEGDPGEGKTTLVLKLAAMLSKGLPLPCDDDRPYEPIHIIYQTAEDGIDDTIKPRLEQNGADCSMIRVIDETEKELSMTDERLEQAIVETNAKLIILDPIQAYIGATVDMHRANEIRPVLKKLGMIAEKYQCAVILIGHMNKASGSKSTYRGLGSIDIQATARSVLLSPLIEEYANAVEGKREIQAGNSFRGLLTALGELLNSFKELIVDGICWFPRLMRWQTSKGEVAPVFSDYRNEGYNYRLVAYQNLVTKEQYSVESVQEEIKAENRVGTLEQLERRIEETEVLVRKLHKDKMR